MPKPSVIAIVASDIHLSHRPPIARSAEKSWYDAMARTLDMVQYLINKHNVPFIVAGDIFHHWDEPAELINFAIDKFPHCYAIPGQHDLPNHNYDDIKKSAYWTLVEAGVVNNIPGGSYTIINDLCLHGFPFGFDVIPIKNPNPNFFHIAVIHAYCYTHGTGYKDAPKENDYHHWMKKLGGYDAAVIGDNHVRWENGKIFNCGGLIRRRFDEKDHQPRVGLVYNKGPALSYDLYTEDVFADRDESIQEASDIDMERLIDELNKVKDKGLDFVEILNRFITNHDCSSRVHKLVLKSVEQKGSNDE